MSVSAKRLRRAQWRDALIYWVYIPAAVILGGKIADLFFHLPAVPTYRHLVAISAVVFIGPGVLLVQRATVDLKNYGDGTPNPQAPPVRLVSQGLFSLCRHPMFLGYDLAALGTVLLLRSWGMLLFAYPAFIVLQFRFLQKREEPILARRFGAAYASYRQSVPFLLPNPFSFRKSP